MGSSKFKEYKGLDLPAVNSEVLERWDAVDAFGKSISTREGHPTFVFYEGPPSANGMPGIHHVIAGKIKDVFCRYKTQRGFLVHRKAGWDTHGLPVEWVLPPMKCRCTVCPLPFRCCIPGASRPCNVPAVRA